LFIRKAALNHQKPPNENQRNNYYTGTNGASCYAEDFDNVGLLVGDQEGDATLVVTMH
jgi:hypothetical protein